MTKRCDDCLFAVEMVEEVWECRYHPPMPEDGSRPLWRLVKADFWCSKHNSRKDQEELAKVYRPTPTYP